MIKKNKIKIKLNGKNYSLSSNLSVNDLTIKLKIPAWLIRPIVLPFALQILKQDIVMLDKQREWIERFGGEDYCYSDVDLLGASIVRLLRKASREMIAIEVDAGEPETVLDGELLA